MAAKEALETGEERSCGSSLGSKYLSYMGSEKWENFQTTCGDTKRQMSGMSHGRPHTGTKTLRRCNDGAGAAQVILIDVERGKFSNLNFIDVPESTPKKFRGKTAAKKDKRGSSNLGNIIFIDDDGESNENELLDEIGDDCQFVPENIPPVKFTKCEKTYSGKGPVQNGENVEGRVEDSCITTQRERIKETSEYKKALEEELASRQRALAIQAEEAKKLKLILRRKKAESMRLLEMEKRQKQRVEEMRETLKKDVENMKLKEPIRAEVQKELSKLEMTCHDIASVLSGLGITVGDGTSHEVRFAYKKALLKFHPDRASRSDIRQQVEAEEKFKLISRMKGKYLPTL
ncbi:hypothetical protein HAX54_024616 [Datura stramonium]|uniref:J domain-containing protein n=1 Tax=Datura stramonium TaxID=4076 RepID=A0ABS8RHU7_DATST|nr:hypothetical protein [Datura stramonium]